MSVFLRLMVFGVVVALTSSCLTKTFGPETVLEVENGTYRQVRSKNGFIFSNGSSTFWKIHVFSETVTTLYSFAIFNYPSLRVLRFKRNQLKHIHPQAFVNLISLQELSINDNNVRVIVNGIFKDMPVVIISLANNQLQFIEEEAFENLTELKDIDLSLNQLTEWNPSWFLNCPKIELITLDDNKISVIKTRSFTRFPFLRNLSIGHNELENIEENAFYGLRNLQSLDISGNKLKLLDDHTFLIFKRLEFLSLNGNFFMYLSEQVLNDLRSLETLHIHDNPWKCGCYDKIRQYAYRNNWKVNINLKHCYNVSITTPVCVATNPPSSKCIETIEEDDLKRYIENADRRIWFRCPRPPKVLYTAKLIPPQIQYVNEYGELVSGLVWEYI